METRHSNDDPNERAAGKIKSSGAVAIIKDKLKTQNDNKITIRKDVWPKI